MLSLRNISTNKRMPKSSSESLDMFTDGVLNGQSSQSARSKTRTDLDKDKGF